MTRGRGGKEVTARFIDSCLRRNDKGDRDGMGCRVGKEVIARFIDSCLRTNDKRGKDDNIML